MDVKIFSQTRMSRKLKWRQGSLKRRRKQRKLQIKTRLKFKKRK